VETRTAPRLIGGRYRIDGLLGEGGMARVFDAFDERLERPVAVKILRQQTQDLPGMRKRFQQEALIAARLIHSNIVAVLDFGEDHSASYLVMERLPGSTLRDEIIRGPLPKPRVMRVMAETLGALAAAHKFGVLHRDIKPSNILLHEDGHTKITDFGIAKSFDIREDPRWVTDDVTMTGVVLGTPGYLAPERRAGRPATVQSDLYAVGAVMVESLTGRRFDPAALSTEPLPLSLRDIAYRALATDPLDRFASTGEMLQTLKTRAAESAPMIRPTPRQTAAPATAAMPVRPAATRPGTAILSPPPPSRDPVRRRRVQRRRAIFTAVAVLALAAALFLLLERHVHPTAPAASTSTHHVARARSHPTDSEASAIKTLATSLAHGGLPGDAPLADALDATAAQPAGAGRQSSAQQDLSLAQVLLTGGGITAGQYQDVVNTLQPTGATVTTTPVTAATPPTTPTPGTAPSPAGQLFHDHGHGGHGFGGGAGDQG
jgi:eukaryotic-like serine/threonine-protein kinase